LNFGFPGADSVERPATMPLMWTVEVNEELQCHEQIKFRSNPPFCTSPRFLSWEAEPEAKR